MAASGVFTDAFRQKYADLAGGNLTATQKDNLPLAWFRVGEGGFTVVGTSKVPKVPSETQTTMDATVDMLVGGAGSATGGYFSKAFGVGKVTVVGRTVTVVCELSSTEPNLDSNSFLTGNIGGDPELFELGIFDGDPSGSGSTAPATMLAYCTFDEVVKVSGSAVTLTINIEY